MSRGEKGLSLTRVGVEKLGMPDIGNKLRLVNSLCELGDKTSDGYPCRKAAEPATGTTVLIPLNSGHVFNPSKAKAHAPT